MDEITNYCAAHCDNYHQLWSYPKRYFIYIYYFGSLVPLLLAARLDSTFNRYQRKAFLSSCALPDQAFKESTADLQYIMQMHAAADGCAQLRGRKIMDAVHSALSVRLKALCRFDKSTPTGVDSPGMT